MSYRPTSNYYGVTPNSQSNFSPYATTGDNTNRSSTYQTQMRSTDDARQSQYGQSPYGWPVQNQGASANNAQATYGGAGWHERPNSSNGYNYQRDTHGPSEQSVSDHQAYQSRDLYNSQSAHALNHLAYASGLEPAVSTNSVSRPSQLPVVANYHPSAPIPKSQARTVSPANAGAHYTSNAPLSSSSIPYTSQIDNFATTASNQNLALNAAAALAGAVRNQASQVSQQVNTSGTVRTSNSPRTTNKQPALQQQKQRINTANTVTVAAFNHPDRRLASPPHTRDFNPPSQDQQTSARTARKLPAPEHHFKSQPPKSIDVDQEKSTQQQSPRQPPNSNPQRIANLMTENSNAEQQLHESVEQHQEMPHYIDPSQVFNPYHREHERKKREAAETEARRKEQEQKLADEKRKAAEDAARKQTENSTTANSKSKMTKKNQTTTSGPDSQVSGLTTTAANEPMPSGPASNEERMASEMQKMMSKMKEFRSSNPMLFQKLWNDMRGGGTNTAPPTALSAETPSPRLVQADLSAGAGKVVSTPKSRSRKQETTPSTGTLPMNGFKVVIENNEEGLPDLGRFPAERRIRYAYGKHKSDSASEQPPELNETPTPAPVEPIAATAPASVQAPAPDAVQSHISSQPARSVSTNVTWLEPRRRAVAIAAIHLLKSNPENASVKITAQEICTILERNPSYLDLCAALENLGLRFQRTLFARELLRNVPELHTPASKPNAPISQEAATIVAAAQAQSPPIPSATPQSLTTSDPSLHPTIPVRNVPQPVLPGPGVIKSEQTKPPAKLFKPRAGPLSRNEPLPGSKAAAARKRDFSELIDLTELDKDDNYVLPCKQPRFDAQPQPDSFTQIDTSLQRSFKTNASEPLRFDTQAQLHTKYQPQNYVQSVTAPPQLPYAVNNNSNSHFSGLQQQGLQQDRTRTRMIIAKKLDRSEALQKSYYDPKTVARDILITSGRHPSERPLNLHLAGLIGYHIDRDSDVSTIDWDSVDPGGPPPPKVEYVDILAAPPKFKLVDMVRKRAQLARESQDEAGGMREPKGERQQLYSTLQTPQESRVRSPAPLPVAHPAPPKSDHHTEHLKQRKSESIHVGNKRNTKLTPPGRKISIDIPTGSTSQQSTRSTSQQGVERKPNMETNTPLTFRRRGRPPGSKNKQPSVAAMKHMAKATVVEQSVEQSVERTPEPILHSYKCKWVKCHAELHNIDTLRRHILKKHSPDDDEVKQNLYVCWWKKCRYLEPDGEGNMGPTHVFKKQGEWVAHIDEDHVQPIAQKYGDGPKATQTDPHSVHTARERYLADPLGRATTPLVSSDGNSDHPFDAMVLVPAYPQGPKNDKEKADVTAQNAFMRAHGNKHKDTRKAAEEVVRAMAVRKAKIGPGIDRGGCTLMNEARRSTFIQAPGISRIVDGEY